MYECIILIFDFNPIEESQDFENVARLNVHFLTKVVT